MSAESIGLRGMKEMWAAATIEAGLHRASAGWFTFRSHMWEAERRATASAAVYLAMSPRVRAQLAVAPRRSGYATFFRANPAVRPVLLLFEDQPTGVEVWHRYLWFGTDPARHTSPYTNVARAGRTVPLDRDNIELYVPSPQVIAEVEDRLDSEIPEMRQADAELIVRVGAAESAQPSGLHPYFETKIGAFCEGIAEHFLTAARWTC